MKRQQAIQYLAFDVHQATIVANCRDADGKVVMRATVATEATAILQLVKSCGPRVHVASRGGNPGGLSGRTLALMTSFGRGAAISR
jgi:hypothetical protein